MRQITKDMAEAFKEGKKFSRDNTTVTYINYISKAYLHEHLIATLTKEVGLETLTVSLAGWNTQTTRERVNGLLPAGYKISTKQGQSLLWAFNEDKPIKIGDSQMLTFINGHYEP